MIKNINRVILAMSIVSCLICVDAMAEVNSELGEAIMHELKSQKTLAHNLSEKNTNLTSDIASYQSSLSSWRLSTAFFAIVAIVEGFYLFGEYFDYGFDEEPASAENDSAPELPTCESAENGQSAASVIDEQSAAPLNNAAAAAQPEAPYDLHFSEGLSAEDSQ